ncbi:MAG: OmpA family protein [Bacteroidetes bacterium]|nr:OmpA family protein [Bacteroidota bacterium]
MKQLLLLCMLLLATSSFAQDSLRMRYGFEAGWGANLHTADFRALPGVPNCCPQFTNGSGGGIQGGVFAAWPLSNSLLFGVAASYWDQSATLTNDQPLYIISDGVGQDGVDRHTVSATIGTVGLEPTLSWNAIGSLMLSVGVRAGFAISKNYSQDERIVQPAGTGTFLDSLGNDTHSQVRNQNAGQIPDAASVLFAATVGVGYELPLNSQHSIFLAPQVSYAFALNNLTTVTWKPSGLRAGIGLTFSPVPDRRQYEFDTTILRDTSVRYERTLAQEQLSLVTTDHSRSVTTNGNIILTTTVHREHYLLQIPDRHDITCSAQAVGLDENNAEHPVATLRIEEFLTTNAHPLLGFVFFSEGDSVLPTRYHTLRRDEAAHYELRSLFSLDALGIHHEGLNIIGKRLQQYPNAHLTILGCNSDQSVESQNIALSAARAKTVFEYFRTVWGISENRLIVQHRNLPDHPSNPRTPDGQEENRRVELSCDVPEVLDVFLANDTVRTPNPPQLRIKMQSSSSVGVASWQLDVLQGNRRLHHAEGTGAVPAYHDWDLEHDQASIPRYGEPLRIFLRTANTKGDVAIDSATLPTEVLTVEQKKSRHAGDVIIDRYNLVLFAFGTSAMTPAQERVLTLVRSKLKPTSAIAIEGYTDRSGSAQSNKRLATDRATSTSTGLGRRDATVKGIGEDRLLYPNDTPEGRFLCRTVQITVRTPIE